MKPNNFNPCIARRERHHLTTLRTRVPQENGSGFLRVVSEMEYSVQLSFQYVPITGGIKRHEFINGKLFETYLLEAQDIARYAVPECDVIGLRRVGDDNDLMTVMRPDEALIQARMLVDAVIRVTGGYEIDDGQ